MNLYDRTLRLRHLRLAGWQRECLTWGSLVFAVLLALTGLVSPWGILVLPVALAVVVKGHDLLLGRLPVVAQRWVPADLPGVGPRNESGEDGAGQAGTAQTGVEPASATHAGAEGAGAEARASEVGDAGASGVVAEQGAAEQGAAEQGAAEHGAADHGAAEQGTPDDLAGREQDPVAVPSGPGSAGRPAPNSLPGSRADRLRATRQSAARLHAARNGSPDPDASANGTGEAGSTRNSNEPPVRTTEGS